MSTQMNHYVMIGALLPYSVYKGRYDELAPYMDSPFKGIHHHDGLCVVADGMCGNYVVVGRVLAKSKDNQCLDEPVSVRLREPDDEWELREKIAKLFPGISILITCISFSHYR